MRRFSALFALSLSACGPKVGSPAPTGPVQGEDAALEAADFTCLQDWTRVDRSHVTNLRGHQAEAEAALRDGGTFPVGSVVQLFPGEAMVKRGAGFSPATGDWEFLVLGEKSGQTVILQRGTTEVHNAFGTCVSCHDQAEARYDRVCRTGHGCEDLPGIALKLAARKVRRDGRCGE